MRYNEKVQKRMQSFVVFCVETNTSICCAGWTNDFLGYFPNVASDWARKSICSKLK
jgi:hypothetical protein